MSTDPTCQSCGEPLLFVENEATGRRLPLVRAPLSVPSAEALRSGMVVVSPSGRRGRVLTLAAIEERGERIMAAVREGRLHQTHFADCRDREAWQGTSRRARRGGR